MNRNIYESVISGKSDNNIDFKDFQNLLLSMGFSLHRQRGSHAIYHHPSGARMNVQKDGSKAKPYQVRQLRQLILRYGLQ